MENNNILICLEQLGIGGVETAVLNKATAFKQKGYGVYVLARDGIYKEVFTKKGIHCIDFDFKLIGNIEIEKIKEIANIILDNNINQVHIHQYPCLPYACFACLMTKTAYNIYTHTELTDAFEWFINTFNIQKDYMNCFFENAYKIITVTPKSASNTKKFFGLENRDNFIIERNSINFDEFNTQKQVTQINNFLIIARFEEEKFYSIKNAIDLFFEYSKIVDNDRLKLTIVGDGSIRKKLEEYVISINTNSKVEFVGKTNNTSNYIEISDIVLAIGRGILEAIAMKRVAVISSTKNLKGLVKPDNIEYAIDSNFTGRQTEKDDGTVIPEMDKKDIRNLAMEIKKLDKLEIENIVNYNYEVIYNKLNIKDNSYCIEDHVIKEYDDIIFNLLNEFNKRVELEKKYSAKKCEFNALKEEYNNLLKTNAEKNEIIINQKNIIDKHKNTIEHLQQEINIKQEEINMKQEEINMKQEEINKILNSRRWRISSKFANIVNRLFNKKV